MKRSSEGDATARAGNQKARRLVTVTAVAGAILLGACSNASQPEANLANRDEVVETPGETKGFPPIPEVVSPLNQKAQTYTEAFAVQILGQYQKAAPENRDIYQAKDGSYTLTVSYDGSPTAATPPGFKGGYSMSATMFKDRYDDNFDTTTATRIELSELATRLHEGGPGQPSGVELKGLYSYIMAQNPDKTYSITQQQQNDWNSAPEITVRTDTGYPAGNDMFSSLDEQILNDYFDQAVVMYDRAINNAPLEMPPALPK